MSRRMRFMCPPVWRDGSLALLLRLPVAQQVQRTIRPIILSAGWRGELLPQLEGCRAANGKSPPQRQYVSNRPGLLIEANGVQRALAARGTRETPSALQRSTLLESRRFFSGGAAKPGWTVSSQHQFGPAIPDNAYYGEHATYSYFVLFMRGFRPYLEKIFTDCWRTLSGVLLFLWRPIVSWSLRHNPEFRLQVAALVSFLTTNATLTGYFSGVYQSMVDVSSLLEVQKAQHYATEGFWLTPSEQQEHRLQQYAIHRRDLEHTWENALREATLLRNFDTLLRFLKTADCGHKNTPELSRQTASHDKNNTEECSFRICGIPPSLLWSFSALPYGKDDPHTRTFSVAGHEQPLRSFALSFTSNNLSGNWGDYIDRQDNKNALMRPARVMFTDALIPSTK